MAQTIGMAGIQYGNGRVAALTKAVNKEDLHVSNTDYFVRFFLNSCWWAIRNFTGTRKVAIFKNDNEEFDDLIKGVFTNIPTINVEMIDPWFDNDSSTVPSADLYILIPSYSAFDGVRMSDQKQQSLINQVNGGGAGLLLGEWFHLLQSIPAKRSFSFTGSDTDGLVALSPFNITQDYLVFTDIEQIVYSSEIEDDSMSFGISPSFYLRNTVIDTPFSGHITQIASVKEKAEIYWTTDISSQEVTTTTTTTTTQAPDPLQEIRLKVFDVELVESCGPLKLSIEGPDKDLFILENNEIFLTKYLTEPRDMSINVVASDYFDGRSKKEVIQTLELKAVDCESPISKPIDGTYPAYSYRTQGATVNSIWGDYVKTGVIRPFEEWYFSGKGNTDNPVVAWLGGKHGDLNTLWMQVNRGGTITATMTASNEWRYSNPSHLADASKLFVVVNDSGNNILPSQHTEDIFNNFTNNDEVTLAHNITIDGINALRGTDQQTFSFNVPNPEAVDPVTGDQIYGDIFLVLAYKKDIFRSENDDKIYLNVYFGTPTTTPAPQEEYIIFIVNNIPNTIVTMNGIETNGFKFVGSPDDGAMIKGILLSTVGEHRIFDGEIIVTDTAEEITTDIRTNSSRAKNIDITLTQMPAGGGAATVYINGATVTTTTAAPEPPAPVYEILVEINDMLDNVYMYPDPTLESSYKRTASGEEGDVVTVVFTWHTEDGYEYRPDSAATGSNPGSSDYKYLDRPTITAIVYQTSTNPAMVTLPAPTPADNIQNEIYVTRGWWNSNTNTGDSNRTGSIVVPVRIPWGGGKVTLRMAGDLPDPTTTQPPPPPEPPACDNSIYVICQQVLSCVEDGDGCSPDDPPNSYQQFIVSTCCEDDDGVPLSSAVQLDLVRDKNNAATDATLEDMYSGQCHPSNFEFIGDCLPKDQNGNCQETIHNQIIDVVSCGSSENPLP